MSNLIKAKPLSPELSGNKRLIAEAVQSDLFKNAWKTNKSKISDLIQLSIKKAALESGMNKTEKMPAKELMMLIQSIVDVLKKHQWLKVDEIPVVFHLGSIGDLGEFHGITSRTVHTWCKTYFDTIRQETMKKQLAYEQILSDKLEEEKRANDHAKARELNRKNFISKYNHYKQILQPKIDDLEIEYTDIPAEIDYGHLMYNKFVEAGLIDIDNDEKWKIFNEELSKVKISLLGKDDDSMKKIARINSKSKVFRMHLIKLMVGDVDIEEYLKTHNL